MSALDDVPVFTHCCCCIDLECGAVIISFLTCVLPAAILSGKMLLLTHETTSIKVYEWRQHLQLNVMDIFTTVLGPLLSILILVSIVKKSHKYLLTYLFIVLLLLLVCCVDVLLDFFAHPWSSMVEFCLIVLQLYAWLCLQSLYQIYRSRDPEYNLLLQFTDVNVY